MSGRIEKIVSSFREQGTGNREQLFQKIIDESDPEKRSQLIEFYKLVVENENQQRQKIILNIIITIFFLFGIGIGACGVQKDNTKLLGFGTFILTASVFSIVVIPTLGKNE